MIRWSLFILFALSGCTTNHPSPTTQPSAARITGEESAIHIMGGAIRPEPTAATLKKCPLGHTTLKDVPIVYGLLAYEGPEAEKVRKSIENLEFVSGGCVTTSDSPKHQVTCTTCRFAYWILSTRDPQLSSWHRSSPDPSSFPKPISELVRSFPLPPAAQLTSPAEFTQRLSDKLKVVDEGIRYDTTKPADQIKAEIDTWLEEHNYKCTFSSQIHTSTLTDKVRDILEWKTDDFSASIRLHHEHSDNTSWIMASFSRRTE